MSRKFKIGGTSKSLRDLWIEKKAAAASLKTNDGKWNNITSLSSTSDDVVSIMAAFLLSSLDITELSSPLLPSKILSTVAILLSHTRILLAELVANMLLLALF